MKTALPAFLGMALFLGTATPAGATGKFTVSGYMMNTHMSDHEYTRGYGDYNESGKSDFITRLNLDLAYRDGDGLSLHWRLRAPDAYRWGEQETSMAETSLLFGQLERDWGTVRMGRIPAPDQLGLASLGYIPSSDDFWMTRLGPFDSSANRDSIWYGNTWENGLGLTAYYTQLRSFTESDPVNPGTFGPGDSRHRVTVEPRYVWDGGGVSLGLSYTHDHNRFMEDSPNHDRLAKASTRIVSVNPAIRLAGDTMSLNIEGQFDWGRQYRNLFYRDGDQFPPSSTGKDDITTGLGLFMSTDYSYDSGTVTLGGWWTGGNKIVNGGAEDPTRYNSRRNRAQVDMNDNFYPFVVAYAAENHRGGRTGVYSGNDRLGGNAIWWANTGMVNHVSQIFEADAIKGHSLPRSVQTAAHTNGKANHWGIYLGGNHALTPALSLSYAVGYLRLVNPNYTVGTYFSSSGQRFTSNPGESKGGRWTRHHTQSRDLGWEIDLGLRFKVTDNLTLSSTFGYMFNGDAYKRLVGYRAVPTKTPGADPSNDLDYEAVWRKPKNTYTWITSFVFTF